MAMAVPTPRFFPYDYAWSLQAQYSQISSYFLLVDILTGTMLSDYFALPVIFAICACAHGLAAVAQLWLALQLRRGDGKPSKAD